MAPYINITLNEEDDLRENKANTIKTISFDNLLMNNRLSPFKLDKEMTKRVIIEAKQLAKVCAEISSRTGPVRLARWARPDKNVRLEEFINITAEEIERYSYLPAMEHTFDILNVYLNLLVNYLHQIPAVNEYFCPSSLVRPTKTSLALTTRACMLWSRIQFIHEFINKSENENTLLNDFGVCNAATQTEDVCLSSCENCHITKQLIKNLAETVELICEKYDYKSSNVIEVRKEMETDVFYVSQWAAVTRWCDAIGKDFQLFSDLVNESIKRETSFKDENSVLNEKINELEKEKNTLLEEVGKKGKLLEKNTKELSTLKTQLENNEKTITNITQELQEERNKFLDYKEKWINLYRELNAKKLKIEKLEEERQTLIEEKDKEVFNLKDKIDFQEFTIESLNKKIKELEEKIKSHEKDEVLLKEKIETQQKYEEDLWKNYKEAQEMNTTMKDKLDKLEHSTEDIDTLMQQIQELKHQLIHQPSIKSILRASITGNPLRDMEAQKMLNEEQILVLQQENEDLTNTINRIQAHISSPETVTESQLEEMVITRDSDIS